MRNIIPFIIITIASTLEGYGQPWLGINGVSLPLTILVLSVYGLSSHASKLPWLGLLGGILLDAATLNPFGSQALLFVITGWMLQRVNQGDLVITKKRWRQLGVVCIATLFRPVYLALVTYQLGHNWSGIIASAFIQLAVVAGVVGAVFWYQSKHKTV